MDTKNKLAVIEETEWFTSFMEDCQGLVVKIKNTGWDLAVLYHSLGKRLVAEKDKFWTEGISVQDMMQIVSEEVGRSPRTLYRCIQFYEKYPDINDSPYTENSNWFQIVKDLGNEPKVKAQLESGEGDTPAKSHGQQTDEAGLKQPPHIEWNFKNDRWHILITKDAIEEIDWSDVKDDLLLFLEGLE